MTEQRAPAGPAASVAAGPVVVDDGDRRGAAARPISVVTTSDRGGDRLEHRDQFFEFVLREHVVGRRRQLVDDTGKLSFRQVSSPTELLSPLSEG